MQCREWSGVDLDWNVVEWSGVEWGEVMSNHEVPAGSSTKQAEMVACGSRNRARRMPLMSAPLGHAVPSAAETDLKCTTLAARAHTQRSLLD